MPHWHFCWREIPSGNPPPFSMLVSETTYGKLAKLTHIQQQQVQNQFRSFLKSRGLRQTRERFVILDAIYGITGHTDADALYLRLQKQGHSISRATVYNTLTLLLECELVVRHQFGNSKAKYEPSFLFGQHDHLICLDCQHVMEFCDPRIQNVQEMVSDVYAFKITRHALNFYGHCCRTDCVNRQKPAT